MENLTIQDVRNQLQAIRELRDDIELQQSVEHELHSAVLKSIAAGCDNASDLAKEALKSEDIPFPRWTII